MDPTLNDTAPAARRPGALAGEAAREREALEAEARALAAQLGERASVRHRSRALVAGFVAAVALAATAKLAVDSVRPNPSVLALAVAVAALGVVAVVCWVRGRDLARHERTRFERLREVRRRLGIDPPAS